MQFCTNLLTETWSYLPHFKLQEYYSAYDQTNLDAYMVRASHVTCRQEKTLLPEQAVRQPN
jgi:hypothetical protein